MDTAVYKKGYIAYYGGKKKADDLLTRLQEETGIVFKRVSKRSEADMVFIKKDTYGISSYMGGAYHIENHTDNKSYIYVDKTRDKKWKKMALRHEVGHSLGIIKHSNNPKHAMSVGRINISKWYAKSELKFFKKRWLK